MKSDKRRPRVLISGGGTGGHIFPALSIANILRDKLDAEILFVGADNRMEMERVPAAGYRITGLPVAGFDRRHLMRNFSVLLKLRKSIALARKIVKDFRPDIAIGVGGYASGPTLKAAQRAGVPALPAESARTGFGLDADRPTVLFVGGSLGALTINESVEAGLNRLVEAGLQVIWQTGKNFGDRAERAANGLKGVVATPFISDMASAYAAASRAVARAGAGTISELELLGKPCVLVPSPNVAEDHQTKNAMALSTRDAAVLVTDADARNNLVDTVLRLMKEPSRLSGMSENISRLALRDSDEKIADEVVKILESK